MTSAARLLTLLLVTAATVLCMAAPASAADVPCAPGCDLQATIDGAPAGATIQLGAGAWNAGPYDLGFDIALAGVAGTTISSATTAAAINITGGGTVRDIAFPDFAKAIDVDSSGNDVIISGNTFAGRSGATSIDVHAAGDLTIVGNTFTTTGLNSRAVWLRGDVDASFGFQRNVVVGPAFALDVESSFTAFSASAQFNRIATTRIGSGASIATNSTTPIVATYNYFGCAPATGSTRCTKTRGTQSTNVTTTPSVNAVVTAGTLTEGSTLPIRVAFVVSDGSPLTAMAAFVGVPIGVTASGGGAAITPASGATDAQGAFTATLSAPVVVAATTTVRTSIYDDTISTPVTLVGLPPVYAGGAKVSGTAAIGATLTCVPGTWTHVKDFDFAWAVAGAPAPSAATTFASTPQHVVTVAEFGKKLHCDVRARNVTGTAAYASATPLKPITKRTVAPALKSVKKFGKALACGTAKKPCAIKLGAKFLLQPLAPGVTTTDGAYATILVERKVGKKWKKAVTRTVKLPAKAVATVTAKQLGVGTYRASVSYRSKAIVAPKKVVYLALVVGAR